MKTAQGNDSRWRRAWRFLGIVWRRIDHPPDAGRINWKTAWMLAGIRRGGEPDV